ncbi:coiled-coil domain-containing protein 174 isoform X1 [Procambarus clarkii]|uniref:coiled-coil domain-containing protein 174 isoform X1 n=2 Tax=Procambarus clarkii TaxID=6728 RepID=UPI00374363F1
MESGLIGLRAELHKKREEASRFGARQRGLPSRDGDKPTIKSKTLKSSNPGVNARAARDEEQLEEEKITEEKARSILEKKAAMYERLHGGMEALEDDALNQRYLIDFQKKIVNDVLERKKISSLEEKRREKQGKKESASTADYTTPVEEDKWVEYTDAFGRTRECMKKDLPEMLEQDKKLAKDINKDDTLEEPDLGSEDVRREIQRQKWEQMEERNALKKDLHYQDVLFDEARVHGAGFMKFSSDEKRRKEQMDLLKEFQNETQQGEAAKLAAASKQQKLLSTRLEKVRQRKRLKMGLPIKEDKLKTPPVSDDEATGPPPVLKTSEDTPDVVHIDQTESKKKPSVREWDFGKEGVTAVLSQEEWVDRQRTERNNEFAPPSFYDSHKKRQSSQQERSRALPSFNTHNEYASKFHCHSQSQSQNDYGSQLLDSDQMDTSVDNSNRYHKTERKSEFAPPSTYEYYGPSGYKGKRRGAVRQEAAVENAIIKGLAHLRKMNDK